MAQTSKTLSLALSELINGLEQAEQITISNLAEQLVYDLARIYEPYLPYRKKLQVSAIEQKSSRLYSATCQLVDDNA